MAVDYEDAVQDLIASMSPFTDSAIDVEGRAFNVETLQERMGYPEGRIRGSQRVDFTLIRVSGGLTKRADAQQATARIAGVLVRGGVSVKEWSAAVRRGDGSSYGALQELVASGRLRLPGGEVAPETLRPDQILDLEGAEDSAENHSIYDIDDTLAIHEDGDQRIPDDFEAFGDTGTRYSRKLRGLRNYSVVSANKDKRFVLDFLRDAGAEKPHAVYHRTPAWKKGQVIDEKIRPTKPKQTLHFFDDNPEALESAEDLANVETYRVADPKHDD